MSAKTRKFLVYDETGKSDDVHTIEAKNNRDALVSFKRDTGSQGYITQAAHGRRYILEAADGGVWCADAV